MVQSRYHLHIVDGGDASSTVNAATLFAHLTLRCGQLRNYLLLSASTSDAKRNRENTILNVNSTRVVQLAPTTSSSSSNNNNNNNNTNISGTDDQLLLAAEALLRGDVNFRGSIGNEALSGAKDRIIPYPCFSCKFVESEVSLANSIIINNNNNNNNNINGRYFDFIATADVASFDFLLDYYTALRAREAAEKQNQKMMMSSLIFNNTNNINSLIQSQLHQTHGRRQKVGLIHILCGEPARAGHLLQRFMEMLLQVDNKSNKITNVKGEINQNENEEQETIMMNEEEEEEEEKEENNNKEMEEKVLLEEDNENEDEDEDERIAWVNRVDSVISQMYQLLGVDVLFALV